MPSDEEVEKAGNGQSKEQEAVRQGIAELAQLSNVLNQKANVSSDSQPV